MKNLLLIPILMFAWFTTAPDTNMISTNAVSSNLVAQAIEDLKVPYAVNPPLAPVIRPPTAQKYPGQ